MSVTYKCDLMSPSGYSKAARNHVRGLIEVGVEVRVEDRKKDPSTIQPDAFWAKNLPDCVNRPAAKNSVVIWHETPDFYSPLPHNYNIGVTPWETSLIPSMFLTGSARSNWVAQMNRMNEIWTAAESSKKAFRDSGVVVPIYVMPHPIDLEVYTPGKKHAFKDELNKPFDNSLSLLSVFQWNARKNPADLLNYYLITYQGLKDVRLFVKTYKSMPGDPNDIQFCREAIKKMKDQLHLSNLPGIQAIWSQVPDTEMAELYRSCDVYYHLPYGEGFGLPFQEAAACGRASIYPKSSSMVDFLNDDIGYGVDVVEDCVTSATMPYWPLTVWYQGDQIWWKPLFKSAQKALKQVYKDWKSGELERKGKRARAHIEKIHSFSAIGRLMKERVDAGLKKLGIVL